MDTVIIKGSPHSNQSSYLFSPWLLVSGLNIHFLPLFVIQLSCEVKWEPLIIVQHYVLKIQTINELHEIDQKLYKQFQSTNSTVADLINVPL